MVISAVLFALFVGLVGADVRTTSGILKGRRITTDHGIIHQYLGVPYAQPPIGDLRFRSPVPLIASNVSYDASFFRASCMQPPHFYEVVSPPLRRNDTFLVSEDCLHLNIYAPQKASLLPVMVWLPGEGFDFADAQQYDGTYLALLGDVIVVTVNYRLGAFGFLSTGTEDAPGNVALLDQRMALGWVKDNIAAFGGDPARVTLFGTFSGAMCVSIHVASPLHEKKPLFKRAIIQGGVATDDYVLEKRPHRAAKKLAKRVGCKETENITNCLRNISAETLLAESFKLSYRFRPTVDVQLLPKVPTEAFKHVGNISTDVLLGTNKDSGSICLLTLFFTKSKAYNEIMVNNLQESTLKSLIRGELFEYYKTRYVTLEEVVYHTYRYLKESDSDLRDNYFQFCGDMYVKAPITAMAKGLSSSNTVYVYQFDHRPSFSQHESFFRAAHADDTVFTLGLAYNYENSTKEEKRLSLETVQAFSNFARNGDPNSEVSNRNYSWPRYTPIDSAVLHFGMSDKLVVRNAEDKIFSFWEEVSPYMRGNCR